MVDNIQREKFQSVFFEPEKKSFHVTAGELSDFIENECKLREMISQRKIRYTQEHNLSVMQTYEELEDKCQINMDTMKKTISGAIRISRNFLYKFTVGLHMSLEEANTYFELKDGVLQENNIADYICIRALLDGDDISEFIRDFEKHTEYKISMRNKKR